MLLHVTCLRGTPPVPSALQGHVVPCLVREPFLESQPAADLPMIRQYFPKLAGVEIEVRPVRPASGS
jgi:hypothetical protein